MFHDTWWPTVMCIDWRFSRVKAACSEGSVVLAKLNRENNTGAKEFLK